MCTARPRACKRRGGLNALPAFVYGARVREEIRRLFAASVAAKREFLRHNLDRLVAAVDLITVALRDGHKLLLFGNGGSAADAQHIAAEFVNRFKMKRRPLPAIALTTDTSALTSIANDYGYQFVFAKQVEALGQAGDVALAISTSGNAANVLRAVGVCKRRGVRTIGLTGGSGGKLAAATDCVLRVGGTTETARIQETHILVGHVLCELVDQQLFGRRDRAAV
jgi:D-sedoheptulose 7-phosphate isomerase